MEITTKAHQFFGMMSQGENTVMASNKPATFLDGLMSYSIVFPTIGYCAQTLQRSGYTLPPLASLCLIFCGFATAYADQRNVKIGGQFTFALFQNVLKIAFVGAVLQNSRNGNYQLAGGLLAGRLLYEAKAREKIDEKTYYIAKVVVVVSMGCIELYQTPSWKGRVVILVIQTPLKTAVVCVPLILKFLKDQDGGSSGLNGRHPLASQQRPGHWNSSWG